MPENRLDLQVAPASSASAEQDHARMPFVAPVVEEMGGLSELTLIGGSL
jgi:hypothetical protein